MKKSQHAEARIRQRGIPSDIVDLIVEFGTPRQRPGRATEYVVQKQDRQRMMTYLKHLIRRVDRLDGKGVLVSDDGDIITTYHLTG